MLFRVYARFVPNLTRQDGSAFERMLLQMDAATARPIPQADASPPSTNGENRHA
jgi:integrase